MRKHIRYSILFILAFVLLTRLYYIQFPVLDADTAHHLAVTNYFADRGHLQIFPLSSHPIGAQVTQPPLFNFWPLLVPLSSPLNFQLTAIFFTLFTVFAFVKLMKERVTDKTIVLSLFVLLIIPLFVLKTTHTYYRGDLISLPFIILAFHYYLTPKLIHASFFLLFAMLTWNGALILPFLVISLYLLIIIFHTKIDEIVIVKYTLFFVVPYAITHYILNLSNNYIAISYLNFIAKMGFVVLLVVIAITLIKYMEINYRGHNYKAFPLGILFVLLIVLNIPSNFSMSPYLLPSGFLANINELRSPNLFDWWNMFYLTLPLAFIGLFDIRKYFYISTFNKLMFSWFVIGLFFTVYSIRFASFMLVPVAYFSGKMLSKQFPQRRDGRNTTREKLLGQNL